MFVKVVYYPTFYLVSSQISSLKIALSSFDFLGIGMLPGNQLNSMACIDDMALFSENVEEIRTFLITFGNKACILGMHFSPPLSRLVIRSEVVQCADHSTFLGSLISSSELTPDEIPERIQKARLTFSNLSHLSFR